MAQKTAKKKKLVIFRVTHYSEEDPSCDGDYWDVELKNAEGKIIATFGDYYHDKGEEKAKGFIQGVEYALDVKVEIADTSVADR